jgi:hypothetical protein
MGDLKCREVKTGFCRKTLMQTGSFETLSGWKSGRTTYVPRESGPNGGSVAIDLGSGGLQHGKGRDKGSASVGMYSSLKPAI